MTQRIIGITGGIATGKTTVTNYLQEQYHIPILDADIYAREALTDERLKLIKERYGTKVFTPTGDLDRKCLGNIIFNDKTEQKWIENLIHPYVVKKLAQNAQNLGPTTISMAIPLLFEANLKHLVTEIWVVNCPPELQEKRLRERNQLSINEAKQRILSQMPMAEKIAQADVVLDNSSDLASLQQQIDQAIKNMAH